MIYFMEKPRGGMTKSEKKSIIKLKTCWFVGTTRKEIITMMHLDHEGAHAHVHTHDGVTHSHPHTHDHEHTHEHCDQSSCASCTGCGEHTPREELMALMKYMVNHNTAHANELAELAKKLADMGDKTAYEQVMLAVSDFEKGNLRLSTILAAMQNN